MLQREIKAGDLLKYMSRTVLVLDPRMDVNRGYGDGFVHALETGMTTSGMFNADALEPLEIIKENNQK